MVALSRCFVFGVGSGVVLTRCVASSSRPTATSREILSAFFSKICRNRGEERTCRLVAGERKHATNSAPARPQRKDPRLKSPDVARSLSHSYGRYAPERLKQRRFDVQRKHGDADECGVLFQNIKISALNSEQHANERPQHAGPRPTVYTCYSRQPVSGVKECLQKLRAVLGLARPFSGSQELVSN